MHSYDRKLTISDIDLSRYSRVLLRLDLNVPVKDGVIVDNSRIVKSIPTLSKLLENKLKVIVLSHFSRIKDISDIQSGKKSLKVVSEEIQRLIPNKKVAFVSDIDFSKVRNFIDDNQDVDVFVLENTRYYDVNEKNEVVKMESKNSPELAKFWASLGDLYINDAFGTSHRAHASNVGIASCLPSASAVGFLVEKELKFLSKAVYSNDSPKVLILGGSKVSDKLKLINEIAPKVDKVLIGGGMSYTFLKVLGKEVGSSIVEESMLEECKKMLEKYGSKLVLPVDHVVADGFRDEPGRVYDGDESWSGMALDIGPKTAAYYGDILNSAMVVIWNGPMGVFEFDNFSGGTQCIAEKLVEITKKGAYTVVGGGDSAAAAEKFKLADGMSFISTGGGASLSFFEGSAMPGIDCIPDKK